MDFINQKPGVFLLTTKLDLKLSLKIDKRYLGVWVNGANIKDEKKNIQKFHWEDKDKKNKDYNYIISLYEKLLKKLSQRLNENLGIKKSERYWRIVLGPWLTYYLVVNLDRWETLDKCFETESKFVVTEFEQAKNSLECVDTLEFSKKSEQSDFFNHALFLRILKFQYSDKIKTIKLNEKNLSLNDTYYEKTFHHIKKNNKKNFIFEMISSLALKYNKIIFDDFNFPKKNFIKLNSRFFSIPVKLGKFF